MSEDIVCKVLICDDDNDARGIIRTFCQENHLIVLKVDSSNIMDVLNTNIDLGGVFLFEDVDGVKRKGIDLGVKIHHTRRELPIFLRSARVNTIEDLPDNAKKAFGGIFHLEALDELKRLIDTYLFGMFYPDPLVRGIQEISFDAFHEQVKGIDVTCELPYLVKDQIIFGELFSLIPLESDWCRGYMMLQTEEDHILEMVQNNRTSIDPKKDIDFRDVNSILGEMTNLIWGGIKNQFFSNPPDALALRTQVPTIVNHGRRYISFGSAEPQLCFRYRFDDKEGKMDPVTLYQKLVFNLSWSPDRFQESQKTMDDFVENGELELF